MLGFLLGVLLILGGYAGNIANEDLHIIGYVMMALGSLMVLSAIGRFFEFFHGIFGKRERTAYWTQKTHFLRADEYECSGYGRRYGKPYVKCPGCGRKMTKSKYDPTWVDEIETMDALFGD